MNYKISLAPAAVNMLKAVTDRRVHDLIVKRIDVLANEPEKQGKPLVAELSGYRSIRATGAALRDRQSVG